MAESSVTVLGQMHETSSMLLPHVVTPSDPGDVSANKSMQM